MKNETILAIKKDISKLLDLFKEIRKPFNYQEHKFTMIEVLLNNLAFNPSNTKDYLPDKEHKSMDTIIRSLGAIYKYDSQDWMAGFIYEEAKMAFDGHSMNEECEENYELEILYDSRGGEI